MAKIALFPKKKCYLLKKTSVQAQHFFDGGYLAAGVPMAVGIPVETVEHLHQVRTPCHLPPELFQPGLRIPGVGVKQISKLLFRIVFYF